MVDHRGRARRRRCRAARAAGPRPRGAAYPRAPRQEPTMTTDAPFDPTAPLAGPPEPWESAPTPSARSGPPYHMTDMIAAEPSLARRIVERLAPSESAAA